LNGDRLYEKCAFLTDNSSYLKNGEMVKDKAKVAIDH